MKLRSGKRISKPSTDGNEQGEHDFSSEADDNNPNGSGSDLYYLYGPSSDSDDDSSRNKCEIVEDIEILGKKRKAEAQICIDVDDREDSFLASMSARNLHFSDFAEPSAKANVTEMESKNEPPPAQPPRAADIEVNAEKKKRVYRSNRKRDKVRSRPMWEILEEEHDEWIDEHITEDIDLDQQRFIVNETAEPPAELIMPLLRYQKEWLAWALKQEESETKGGILADEMGMGKTIQAIALVLAKREMLWKTQESNGSTLLAGSSIDLSGTKPTLVVCPVVAVSQWVSEIDRFTTTGSTKVLVYHGANRRKSSKRFSGYDFVITTYGTVEAEFRKYMMPPKKKCAYCGKLFYEKKLSVHLKYYCGPNSSRSAKQSKQDRKKLNTAPLASMHVIESRIDESHGFQDDVMKGAWKRKQHGEENNIEAMENWEVKQALHKEKSLLYSVKWDRIILDEAHYVKDRSSNTAKAIFALESSYKWALTGTPIQNRVGELYSLVRFLQVVPYSYYVCKACDCLTLDYRPSAQCSRCPHNYRRHFSWWNKYISKPIKYYGGDLARRAMILLKHKVLGNIILRRTKEGRAADLALPPRMVMLRRDTLDVKEEDYYQSLCNESRAQFNTYVEAGTVMNNYAHIFELITRLRQAVNHPYLIVYSKTAIQKGGNLFDAHNGQQDCGICHDSVKDRVVTTCHHVFCKACLDDFSTSLGHVLCPMCSSLITLDLIGNLDGGDQTAKTTIEGFKSSSILNSIQLNDFQTSTKIEALREEIRFMVERDGSAKGIVFSQFTSFLDLISYSLHKSGINCGQLVGSMSLPARDAAIKKFTEDPDCKILLMSLKAGGVALNLTVASHVFLMDPWWNPAVERQAQDRVHRIGQNKPIRIVRFIIENTIEEKILELQGKKELAIEGTVGDGSLDALAKLTMEDLHFLFNT
ncbi:DNA repair protein RAD16 isoform X2 [Hevea brasiliensis]|uniref:DNA repair protein RAD16 isoform X2 n=1 Tax=Hevea brasiliensis TaxID=3981 RepID=UPI0025D370C9|nr:DNA repair protein RAD16 isoform X2 [Hevea brasiliensis]